MKISLSSGTLYTFPLRKVFTIASELAFDGIELIINQEFQRVNTLKLIEELQESIPILSIHAPFMPLDGSKIFAWNKVVWAIAIAAGAGLYAARWIISGGGIFG